MERAERSGWQMSTLLGDILDFSDLQNEDLVIAQEMFELGQLAQEIERTFGPIIRREGVDFGTEIAEDAPRGVVGDLVRLRQALGHFVIFFVDVIGSKDVRVRMLRDESGIRFEVDSAVPGDDLPGWQPEAMFDRSAAEYGDFASDALGPTIGRGLITLMGGSFELRRREAGRATLVISVPLEMVDGARQLVRVEAGSVTVQAVLGALLRQLGCELWEPGSGSQAVTAILMEAGGDDETARAARLRSDHPGARLVAVGEPNTPALFEYVCAQPVTRETLSSALGAGAPARLEVM